MRILIVESDNDLAQIWMRALARDDLNIHHVVDQTSAVSHLQENAIDLIILDLSLRNGSALAVADYASYRHPDVKIIPVSSTTFFSDGSVFEHIPNACTMIRAGTQPEDLAALVEYYGVAS